ncbi:MULTISPECIES: sigma-70 family RNA polymerase sigma factor [Bacillaceae]|nr:MULTISPECIES: sigma-70 family RNA polymerase sigma factor [Bacillaceae]
MDKVDRDGDFKFEDKGADHVLEELIDAYYKPLMNLAFTYVKDWSTAEDIVQEVMIKVFRQIDSFEGKASIKTWIYRITMNQCKDYLRKTYVKRVFITGMMEKFSPPSKEDTPEATFVKGSRNKEMAEAVLELPTKYSEAIILYYYEELSMVEMSEVLNLNVSTIKSRLQRGRKKLKVLLEKRGISYDSL